MRQIARNIRNDLRERAEIAKELGQAFIHLDPTLFKAIAWFLMIAALALLGFVVFGVDWPKELVTS